MAVKLFYKIGLKRHAILNRSIVARIAKGRREGFACIAHPQPHFGTFIALFPFLIFHFKARAIKFPKVLSATTTPALSAQNPPADLQQFFNLV